jgi:hypothetical protein
MNLDSLESIKDNILPDVPEVKEKIELTEEQKNIILDAWNKAPQNDPPAFKYLVELVWDKDVDSRSVKGRVVREFLATRKLRARAAQDYIPKNKIELSPEQQEYISNNCGTMKPVEIARALFKNDKLTPLHQESIEVIKHIKSLDKKLVYSDIDKLSNSEYKPPKTLQHALARINRFLHHGLNETKLTPKNKRDIHSLIGYLHSYRFLSQINAYEDNDDKYLFESEFIRCCYDKNDLEESEVDQYIIYASEVVIGRVLTKRIATLEAEQDRQLEESNGRINMALVDTVKALRDEYNKCVKRQNDLLKTLKGERQERINSQIKDTASILNLVNLWKDEESRKALLALAEKEKDLLKEGIEKIKSMEETKAYILGLSDNEMMYG